MSAPDVRCLSRTINHGVEPRPHSTFLGGRAWDCPRCGRTFSEATPTYAGRGLCNTAAVRVGDDELGSA